MKDFLLENLEDLVIKLRNRGLGSNSGIVQDAITTIKKQAELIESYEAIGMGQGYEEIPGVLEVKLEPHDDDDIEELDESGSVTLFQPPKVD